MIVINEIVLDRGNSRISSDLDIDGNKFNLWFEVDPAYSEYLTYERGDAFVMGVLPYALRHGQDITCKVPCSAELIYNINEYLLLSLVKYEEKFYSPKITAKLTDEKLANTGAVGCGISCGVDSLYSIYRHQNPECGYLKLTHLAAFNNGSFGGFFQKTGWERTASENLLRDKDFAHEMGLPLVRTNSNLGSLVQLRMDYYATYFMLFNIMSLAKLFGIYIYSSVGLDLVDFKIKDSDKLDCSHYDLLSLNCCSITGGLKFYSGAWQGAGKISWRFSAIGSRRKIIFTPA
jgi:hypothetical protein